MTRYAFKFTVACATFFLLALFSPSAANSDEVSFSRSALEVVRDRTGLFWEHLNDDDRLDLLISDDASLMIYTQTADARFADDQVQTIRHERSGAIYDLADLNGDETQEIVILDERGVEVYEYDRAAENIVHNPEPLLSGMRGITLQHLTASEFVFDIDGDGVLDLIYPQDGRYYIFFQRDGVFTMTNQIATRPVSVRIQVGEDYLDESVVSTVSIPRITFVDLNGDTRPDLRVRQEDGTAFYLQSADGTIPETPSYQVDLSRFRSEGRRPDAWQAEQFQFIPSDLNGDGREDYVIVSGNRIRVFNATETGVDFTRPDHFVKLSTESMSVLLVPLTDSPNPDLVVIKYELPSLGRIIAGLAIGLRFEIEVLGYENDGHGAFSRRPVHRSTMVFKIPPFLKLFGEIENLAAEFESIGQEVAALSTGDYNGDGRQDAMKIEGETIDFYLSTEEQAMEMESSIEDLEGSTFIREVLFGEKRRDVTLDTMMAFIRDVAGAFQSALIADREPTASIPLGEVLADRVELIVSRDLNGDGIDDFVVFEASDPEAEVAAVALQRLHFFISESGADTGQGSNAQGQGR